MSEFVSEGDQVKFAHGDEPATVCDTHGNGFTLEWFDVHGERNAQVFADTIFTRDTRQITNVIHNGEGADE